MASQTPTLLAELSEADATGRLAEIYDEIRRFSGVPYVSSLQRYLATLPGVLEWTWDALRPAMVSGAIPETGWRLARAVRLPPIEAVSAATPRAWGVDAAGLQAIRNVATNFVRVSPVNLVTGACLASLLNGASPTGSGPPQSEPTGSGLPRSVSSRLEPTEAGRARSGPTESRSAIAWTPPRMLPPMPGNVDPLMLPPDQRAVLMRFATEVDGKPFIPALYRQLAHWPAVLDWLANELGPRFDAPETAAARAAFRTAARQAAPDIVARLPGLPDSPPPDADTVRRVLATIDRYAQTSPEMTMFGQLILDALPNPG